MLVYPVFSELVLNDVGIRCSNTFFLILFFLFQNVFPLINLPASLKSLGTPVQVTRGYKYIAHNLAAKPSSYHQK